MPTQRVGRPMSRRLRAAGLSLAIGFALTGCGSNSQASPPGGSQPTNDTSSNKEVIIGLSTQDLQNEYWLQLIDSFKKAANGKNVKIIVGTTNQDPAGQAQEVQNFLSQGAQAIVVSPVNPAAMQPVFDQAMKQGVYVINNHFPAEFGHYDVFLDTGPYNSGYIAGSEAADVIKADMGGQANCTLLTLPENETLTTRMSGITDALKKLAPNAKVVAEQRAESQSNAETVVGNVLTAHPDVNCLLGWSDSVVLGGVSAIKNRGDDPSKFVIVGIDATQQALAAIQSGEMDGTVNNPPDKFGALAFEVAYGLITDANSPWHFVQHAITTLQAVNKDNLKDFLK